MKDGRSRPKKRFGQNFLHDRGIAARIVDAAGIGPGDAVVELGPGRGVLTRFIVARGARLMALELDRGLVDELRAEFGANPGVEIVSADFTKVTLGALLNERGLKRCVLIGNIPYHLTRDVLFDFLVDEYGTISRAVIMVQREVGDRISSKPGNRTYGIPSVVLQSLYQIEVVARAGAGALRARSTKDSSWRESRSVSTSVNASPACRFPMSADASPGGTTATIGRRAARYQ